MQARVVKPIQPYGRSGIFTVAVAAVVALWGCAPSARGSLEASQPRASDAAPTRSPAASPVAPTNLQGALEALANGRGSGAIALVQSPEGTWRGASGLAGSNRPAEPGNRFEIASTTKTFVATVVLQLVAEGRLSLDESVEEALPGRVRDGERITIRELMNHTSGIGQSIKPTLPPLEDQGPLGAPPGTKHSYSNMNYVILGLVVEALTGDPLDVVIRDRIFDPLGLDESSYGSVAPRKTPEELPDWLGSATITFTGDQVSGAGGIVSTAEDLATFLRAPMDGELLGEDQLAEMLRTVDASTDPLAQQGAAAAQAGLGIFGFKLACGSAWGHGGDNGGYSNQVLVSRDGSKVVVVAQNAQGWPGVNATALQMYCL